MRVINWTMASLHLLAFNPTLGNGIDLNETLASITPQAIEKEIKYFEQDLDTKFEVLSPSRLSKNVPASS